MMSILERTGIFVSLLILLEATSRHALASNDLMQNHNSSSVHHSWSHHNNLHHHHHHHQNQNSHQRPRVLHDSLRNPRNRSSENSNRSSTLRPSEDTRDGIRGQLNKPEKLTAVAVAEYSGTRAVAYAGFHGNQRFRPEGGFMGLPLTTTTTTPSPTYSRFHPGRRVCTRQAPTSQNRHEEREVRFVYTEVSSSSFICCPGWSQATRNSYGCNRPICVAPCHNGGVCGTHGKCNCPKGFTGSQCQVDVDECVMEKPCAQICRNLPGSYECQCRYGFQLQPDGQSCRKNDSDGTAFEARDLENDYGITTGTKEPGEIKPHDTENEVTDGELEKDYGVILKRLTKLEKQFARGKKRDIETVELSTKVNQAVEGVAELRVAAKNALHFLMETFGPVRQEVYNMKNKFDLEHRRVDYLIQRVAELDHRLGQNSGGSMKG